MFQAPGYSTSDPGQVTCGCEGGADCYRAASDLASTSGEKDSTGEQLLYLAQCACFQGSVAGCNTLSHFAKDYIAACAQDHDAAMSCAVAGFVHYHGVQVPRLNGRSFDRDPAAARTEFEKACRAGSSIACSYASK
jgi:TPR repeat protein